MPVPIEPPIRAELRIQTVCLSVLTVVAGGFALSWLKPVLIPVVMAAFLALALMPFVDFLEVRVHLPRTLGVCAALLLAVMVLVGMGVLVEVSVNQITGNVGQYEERLEKLLNWISELPPVQWLEAKSGASTTVNAPAGSDPKPGRPAAATQEKPANPERTNPLDVLPENAIRDFLLNATGVAWGAAWGIVSQSVIVLVFLFFLLMSSVKRNRPIGGAWGEMEDRIRGYLVTMTLLSAVTGALVGAVLSILGVQAAVLFGILTFLLNFIPNVGSFIATLLPAPLVLLTSNFTVTQAILALGIPAIIQFGIGNFVQPKLMGEHMQLHPVVILISLIFWGILWGVVGMFLAVPITSIIRIACDRHPLTKPVADLMAGRLDAFRDEPIEAVVPQ